MVSAVNITATATPDLRVTARDISAIGVVDPSAVQSRDDAGTFTDSQVVPVDGSNGRSSGGQQGQGQQSNTGGDDTGGDGLSAFLGKYLGQLLTFQEGAKQVAASAVSQATAAYQAVTSRSGGSQSQNSMELSFPGLPPMMASGRRVDLYA